MAMINGYLLQLGLGTLVTLKLASCACLFGMLIGIVGALIESIPYAWLKYPAASFIFLIRGLPELLVLFFIYFGVSAILSHVFNRYVDVSAFAAGTIALGLIFGAYASQVFRGAFLAVEVGQIEAGKALGLSAFNIFRYIMLPQAWRHALPGLGNLCLVLLKDTAIVTLIGLSDLMTEAKLAAATTQSPFTFYLFAACIYLSITTVFQYFFNRVSIRANRYLLA